MELRYQQEGQGSAPRWNADMRVLYSLSPCWVLGARGGWVRLRPDHAYQRYETWWGGVEFRAEHLSLLGISGFGVELSHDWHFTDYDRPNFLLSPDSRKNRLQDTRVTLYNQRLHYKGFSPALTISLQRQHSNIVLSEYSRTRVELSIRRLF